MRDKHTNAGVIFNFLTYMCNVNNLINNTRKEKYYSLSILWHSYEIMKSLHNDNTDTHVVQMQ